MREILREKRIQANMTQTETAKAVGIGLRMYQHIEYGRNLGSIKVWDQLEDLFQTHQRKLREVSKPIT